MMLVNIDTFLCGPIPSMIIAIPDHQTEGPNDPKFSSAAKALMCLSLKSSSELCVCAYIYI